MVDEYTRECLALEVRRTLKAPDVIDVLADLFVIRGAPKCIRSDNGPESAAAAIRQWLAQASVETLYITPGSPWENCFVESFHSRFRDKLLDREVFDNIKHAQSLVAAWQSDYNHRRAAQQFGLPDSGKVFRGVCGGGLRYAQPAAAHAARRQPLTHSPTHTLITLGTKTGGRSPFIFRV